SPPMESYLADRRIMVWSADFPIDDWRHIPPEMVMARALDRLDRKGKGVMLLHDVQASTTVALPYLLRELKARGYKIVHVVWSTPDRPKTETMPRQWILQPPAGDPRPIPIANRIEPSPAM